MAISRQPSAVKKTKSSEGNGGSAWIEDKSSARFLEDFELTADS